MATSDETLRALLDQYLETIRFWVDPWRHRDFYRHRKTGKHLQGWHEHTARVRNAIHHVRALRKALGIRPHATMTHEVGDLWNDPYGWQARTIKVTPEAVKIRLVHPAGSDCTCTGTPLEFTRAGWRRLGRDT